MTCSESLLGLIDRAVASSSSSYCSANLAAQNVPDNKNWQLHPKVRVSKDSIGRAGTLAAGTEGGLLVRLEG